MERFKKIAVLYSGHSDDRAALNHAASLARTNRAKINVISVMKPISSVAQLLLGRERMEQMVEDRRGHLKSELNAQLKQVGIESLPLHLVIGEPAIEAIRYILQHGCDLLMKVRDPVERNQAISLTDRKLLRKCPIPVILLERGRGEKFTRIMAAVDPDPSQPSRLDLHRNVLKLAISMAEREGAELDIVHSWDSSDFLPLQGPRFKMSEEEVFSLIEEGRRLHAAWLAELLAPHAGQNARIESHLIQGDPAKVLIEFARERRSQLLIMGTVARGGLPGVLIGNTAEQVLDAVKCSTLTVKPPDFHCPVKLQAE